MTKKNTLIRWAGGKSWFIPEFQRITRKLKFKNYFEPFVGGASIFFSSIKGHKSYLSDINEELITLYEEVRDNAEQLVNKIKSIPVSAKEYYRVRDLRPSQKLEIASRFLYLNHFSFNGVYRVNAKGEYNVPFGKRIIPYDTSIIYAASKKFKTASFKVGDFSIWTDTVKENDLVFLDPPYSVSNKKNENGFIQYNQKLFSLDDQKRLRVFIDSIRKKGAYYILTNAYNEEIKKIFEIQDDSCIALSRACVIGGTNAKRGVVKEYMFTNIPTELWETDDV